MTQKRYMKYILLNYFTKDFYKVHCMKLSRKIVSGQIVAFCFTNQEKSYFCERHWKFGTSCILHPLSSRFSMMQVVCSRYVLIGDGGTCLAVRGMARAAITVANTYNGSNDPYGRILMEEKGKRKHQSGNMTRRYKWSRNGRVWPWSRT
jgi:hypothetical protein